METTVEWTIQWVINDRSDTCREQCQFCGKLKTGTSVMPIHWIGTRFRTSRAIQNCRLKQYNLFPFQRRLLWVRCTYCSILHITWKLLTTNATLSRCRRLGCWDSTHHHHRVDYNTTTNRNKPEKMFVKTRTEINISRMTISFSFWDNIMSGVKLGHLYEWRHCNRLMYLQEFISTCKIDETVSLRKVTDRVLKTR